MVWKPKALRTTYGGYSTSAWKEYYNEELNDPITGALNNSNAAALEYRQSLEDGARASARGQFDAAQAAEIEKKRKKLEKKLGKKVKKAEPVDFSRPDRHQTATQMRSDNDDGWAK